MRKKVLVLGGNFGGLTAALSVKHELEGDVDVTVVSMSDRFLFNPSLIWLPFGLRRRATITYVTAEPFLGHFGIGGLPGGEKLLGLFCKKEGIRTITNTAMTEVRPHKLLLADDRALDFAYAMIIPPFLGQHVVGSTPGLADDSGYVPVHDTYQSTADPNIAAQIRGDDPTAHKGFGDIPAVCVMDAGNNGVVILADKMLPPRKAGVMIPCPQAHAAKLLFEKYFLWKARNGYVRLP
jgi:hypothetical protein